jgi:hygromycin-B 4-O-kinase
MAPIKANMDTVTARRFLCDHYKCDIADVLPIEQGELSRAYFFKHQGGDYVIRFNNSGDGFARERLLFKMFSSPRISMPSISDVGRSGDLSYCISVGAPGRALICMPLQQIQQVMPDLLDQFVQFQQLSLEGTHGYGIINAAGNGSCGSWREFMELFFDETADGFWYGWKQLFKGGMLERDFFESCYTRMMELADYVPRERFLVHGDFHLGNIISDGSRITGIVDWEMGMYGDFVFDIATMDIWTPELEFTRLFQEYTVENGVRIDDFEERLQCAYLFKSLDGLRFYAKKNDRNAYEHMKRFIEQILVR